MTYTQTQLTELAEQKPDEFVKVLAEVCYGWNLIQYYLGCNYDQDHYVDDELNYQMDCRDFNPLAKNERGRSQAFELAEKFNCFPERDAVDVWYVLYPDGKLLNEVHHKDPQTAISIACILTAQGDEEMTHKQQLEEIKQELRK